MKLSFNLCFIFGLVLPTFGGSSNVWYSENVQYWGDFIVNPGQPITVHCKMSAFDSYLWTRNGIPLSLEDNRLYFRQLKTQDNLRELRVTINEATAEWSGDYRCNRFSREYHKVTVRAEPGTKPERVNNTTIYNQILVVGEPNTVVCPVLTDESVPISWFKNGHQLLPKSNIVTKAKELIIVNAQPSDAGEYMCTVVSIQNLLETGHIIHLQHKAVVIPFVKSMELPFGENLTLECMIYGNPVPKITWFVGNLEVTPSGRRYINRPVQLTSKKKSFIDDVLTIGEVSLSDSNLYTCRAENILGGDETSTILSVVESSIITNANKYTRELQFRLGYPLVLQCNSSDNPTWNVIWFKDDNRIESTPPKIQIIEENNTLIINNTTESDTGEYICMVHGHKVTKIITATIFAQTRKLVASGEDNDGFVEMVHERPLVLQCNASNNRFDWEVVWYKDFVLQTNDHHVAINDYNNSLIISHPKDDDPGDYMCVVKATKVDKLINATIFVRNKPRIKRFEGPSRDLQEGDTLDIHCVINTGLPTPEITWYKDGELIERDNEHFILLGDGYFADARLIVEEVVPLDRAVYTCKAENWLGFDEVHILIRVRATLAPLWPAIGICLEFAVLFMIIAYDKKHRVKRPVHRPMR